MPHRGLIVAAALLLSLATAAGGCSSNGGKSGGTATPKATATVPVEVTSTPAPAETPTPAPDIRQQDLSRLPAVSAFIATAGGQVDTAAVVYADVTGDGVDDAVVPISSGGEGGDIALFVFGYGPGGLNELLRLKPSMRFTARVTNGALQVDEAQLAPGDPMCCPSQLQRTTYRWNGQQLVIGTQETIPAPGH